MTDFERFVSLLSPEQKMIIQEFKQGKMMYRNAYLKLMRTLDDQSAELAHDLLRSDFDDF
jgi:hypothetical protein